MFKKLIVLAYLLVVYESTGTAQFTPGFTPFKPFPKPPSEAAPSITPERSNVPSTKKLQHQPSASLQKSTTVQESQLAAIRQFPSLAVKDSPLNKLFVSECSRLRLSKPEFVNDPNWPMNLAQTCSDQLNPPVDSSPISKSTDNVGQYEQGENNRATLKADGKKRIESENLAADPKAQEKNTPQIPGHNTVGTTGSDSSTGNKAMPPKSVEDIIVGANSHYSLSGILLFFAKDGRFTLVIQKPQRLNTIERGTWVVTGSNTFQIRLCKDFDESDAAFFLAHLGILSHAGLIDGETGVGFVGYDFALGKHDGTLLRYFGRTNASPDDINSFL